MKVLLSPPFPEGPQGCPYCAWIVAPLVFGCEWKTRRAVDWDWQSWKETHRTKCLPVHSHPLEMGSTLGHLSGPPSVRGNDICCLQEASRACDNERTRYWLLKL